MMFRHSNSSLNVLWRIDFHSLCIAAKYGNINVSFQPRDIGH